MGPHRAVAVLAGLALVAAGALVTPPALASPSDAPSTPAPAPPEADPTAAPQDMVSSLLVRYAPGVDAPDPGSAVPGASALDVGVVAGAPVALGWSTVTLDTPLEPSAAAEVATALAGTAEVAAAEPDLIMRAMVDPVTTATTATSTTSTPTATSSPTPSAPVTSAPTTTTSAPPSPTTTSSAPVAWTQFFVHPDDTYFSRQWGFASYGDGSFRDAVGDPLGPQVTGINLAEALSVPRVASPVVAVIDTGITVHPDLAGVVLPGYDFISNPDRAQDGDGRDADPSDQGSALSAAEAVVPPFSRWGCGADTANFHGTHVAGTIAALTDNGVGVAGAAPAQILPLRALGACGGSGSDILSAIIWAAGGHVDGIPDNTHPAQVVNMSLGGTSPVCPAPYRDAIAFANARGTAVVVAAGNEDTDAAGISPANCPGVITVAATDEYGARAVFSNYGPDVDVAAPGVMILSTYNSGVTGPDQPVYGYMSGTSMATPHVVGAIALLLAVHPGLTPTQVEAAVEASAAGFKESGRTISYPGLTEPPASTGAYDCVGDDACGAGYLDAAALLGAATNPAPPRHVRYAATAAGTDQRALDVSWTAPRGPVDGYRIDVSVPDGVEMASLSTNGTEASFVVDVADGTAITVTVTALAAGVGGVATEAMAVPSLPGSVPAPPVIATVSPLDSSVHVSAQVGFSAPGVTSLVVSATPVGGGTSSSCVAGPLTTEGACIVEGLVNGVTYDITATAHNPVGASEPASGGTATPSPVAAPSAPGAPVAMAQGVNVGLSWAPAEAGSSPVVGYVVSTDPLSPASCTIAASDLPWCVMSDVTFDTPMTFTVTAVDSAGRRTASAPSEPFVLTGTPVAPSAPDTAPGVTFDGLSASLEVFGNVDVWGGAPLQTMGWRQVASPGGRFCDIAWDEPLTCTIDGLTNGETYTFRTYAFSAAGLSPASDASLPSRLSVPLTSCSASWSTTTLAAGATATARVDAAGPETGFARHATYVDDHLVATGDPTAVMSGAVLSGPLDLDAALALGMTRSMRVEVLGVDVDGAPTGAVLCSATLLVDPTVTSATGEGPAAAGPVPVVPSFTG